MGGIGKTTLAQNAYEHSLIVHHFDIRTWVTVSQKYNVKQLLLQLLSMISSEIDSEDDEQLLGQKLHKILWGRRYLIVIDDIRGIEAWDRLNLFFPENNNGSRIVVTTRISNVATHFDSSLFELSFLDEDKSWDLFCKKNIWGAGLRLELANVVKIDEVIIEESFRGQEIMNFMIDNFREVLLHNLFGFIFNEKRKKIVGYTIEVTWSYYSGVTKADLSSIRGRVNAPSEIWEMRQLRHVDIWELHLHDPPPQSGDQQQDDFVLQNLQTLKNVKNFVWSEEACKRVVNVRKLKLEYGIDGKMSNNDYQLYNVSQLHKLESLSCVSYCKDERLRKFTFPSSLKKLRLEGFMVRYQDLTVIGSLPCLEVLKLLDSSIKEPEWNPVEGEFLRLKFLLVLWSGLVSWNVESSHFPVLEKLVLLHMEELDGIPLDIGEIPTLRLLELKSCNESMIMSAIKIAEEQEDAGSEILQVRVEFFSEYLLERFKKKMKQSGDHNLTRNNLQVVTKKYGPIGS
ncbi:hypothetical protein ABFS83_04G156000 [Erythranthe nasuta]